MDRTLIRYLLVVLLGLAAAVWLADQAYLHRQKQVPNREALMLSEILASYCATNPCNSGAAPWPGLLFMGSAELSLPQEQAKALERGKLIRANFGTEEHFYYLRSGGLIAQLGPFENTEVDDHGWYSELFYLLLGLSILLCLWPLVRDLQGLKEAATRFARDRDPEHFRFRHSSFFTPVSEAMIWMSQRLARSLALQRELSATLSHELRTPISRLKFAVNSLPPACSENVKAELQEDLDELEQLVAEYLTFARQEHERPLLDFRRVDLVELLEPILLQFEQYSSKQIHLSAPESVPAIVDTRSIIRVFKNLIENGVKYACREIRVSLYISHEGIVFCIEDDGHGLEGRELEDIFLPYVREERASQVSGYGLGLAIVRKIVDWHDGRIAAGASKTLGGARFELCLPAVE